jgi:hypothetical protein
MSDEIDWNFTDGDDPELKLPDPFDDVPGG